VRLTPERWKQPTAFAPLEGVGNAVLRELVAEQGQVGLLCAPYLWVGHEPPAEARLVRQVVHAPGVPLSAQLLGVDPGSMARAAAVLDRAGAEVIDVNLGCPAKQVVERGAGAALLRNPEAVLRLLSRVRAAVRGTLSAKIRIGFDDTRLAFEVAEAAAAAGVDFLTVHPRRRCDFYDGVADWRWTREIQARVPIPVVGNGDCWYAADAIRLLAAAGCAAVMIGRPALRNPWIFSQIAALREGREPIRPDGAALVAWLHRAAARYQEVLGKRRTVVRLLKVLINYLGRAVADEGAFRQAALHQPTTEAILALAEVRLGGLPAERLDLEASGRLGLEVQRARLDP
jgi:nifR3 family TIM-barrel protein